MIGTTNYSPEFMYLAKTDYRARSPKGMGIAFDIGITRSPYLEFYVRTRKWKIIPSWKRVGFGAVAIDGTVTIHMHIGFEKLEQDATNMYHYAIDQAKRALAMTRKIDAEQTAKLKAKNEALAKEYLKRPFKK